MDLTLLGLIMFACGWAACDISHRYIDKAKPEYDADSIDDLVPYESNLPTLQQLACRSSGNTPTLIKPRPKT